MELKAGGGLTTVLLPWWAIWHVCFIILGLLCEAFIWEIRMPGMTPVCSGAWCPFFGPKAKGWLNDTSIFFRDTIGCLKPCLIMMETGPGCFECDIREDEMSHSNLALDKVSCSKSLKNSGHDLALCWFITADHLKFIHRPLIQNGKAFVKITSFKQTAINFSRSQGAQDFITQNDIYKLLSWHYLLSNHCKCVPC